MKDEWVDGDLSIERVFNLGDYKSLRVKVNETDANTEQLADIAIKEVCAAYMTYFVNGLISAMLVEDEEKIVHWNNQLVKIEEIRKDLMTTEE